MFDIFAKLLSSLFTFLFPVFASYKALKTSDPALLTPWLMYWVVLACCLLVESWTDWVLVWIPFYAWMRAAFLLYLILPQTQGARLIYQQHVDPFLRDNELAIDDFITSAHERAKQAGLSYIKQGIELVKQYVFGMQPKQPSPPPTPSGYSYTQSLMTRFSLPNSRTAAPAAGGSTGASTGIDFNSLLSSALGAATARGAAAGSSTRDMSDSGSIIPPNVKGNEEKMSFIAAQRERLSVLMAALDTEQRNISDSPRMSSMSLDGETPGLTPKDGRRGSSASGLSKSRSEADFEKIERSDESADMGMQRPGQDRSQSGSWLPWAWKAGQQIAEGIQHERDMSEGHSSGVEPR